MPVLKVLTPDGWMRVHPLDPPFAHTDTFTRADGPLGGLFDTFYNSVAADWAVASNLARAVNGISTAFATLETGERAVDVSVDVAVQHGGTSGNCNGGIVYNVANALDFFLLVFNAGGWAFVKFTGGVDTLIASGSPGGLATYRVVHQPDGAYTVYRNATVIASGTSALHAFGTGVGILIDNTLTRLDNLVIESIRSPGRLKFWTGTGWAVEVDGFGHPLFLWDGTTWQDVGNFAELAGYETALYDTANYG